MTKKKVEKNLMRYGLHALVWKEGKWFVAKAVELELASQGKTKEEALKNLEEAAELYFEDENVCPPEKLQDLEIQNFSPAVACCK